MKEEEEEEAPFWCFPVERAAPLLAGGGEAEAVIAVSLW